jgi:hypothetical protein
LKAAFIYNIAEKGAKVSQKIKPPHQAVWVPSAKLQKTGSTRDTTARVGPAFVFGTMIVGPAP